MKNYKGQVRCEGLHDWIDVEFDVDDNATADEAAHDQSGWDFLV